MTKNELADALARAAIASICQPQRCEAIILTLAKLAKGEDFSTEFPLAVYEIGPDGNRRLARLDAAGEAICPRQGLSPAAEQWALRNRGPCMCASCVACRARPMSVLHLHADGLVERRTGPEAVAEWEEAVRDDIEREG